VRAEDQLNYGPDVLSIVTASLRPLLRLLDAGEDS